MHQVLPDPLLWVGGQIFSIPPPCGGGRLEVTIYAAGMHVHGPRHVRPSICDHLLTYAHICIHMKAYESIWKQCHCMPACMHACMNACISYRLDHIFSLVERERYRYAHKCMSWLCIDMHAYTYAACICAWSCMHMWYPPWERPTRPENGDPTHWGGVRWTWDLMHIYIYIYLTPILLNLDII